MLSSHVSNSSFDSYEQAVLLLLRGNITYDVRTVVVPGIPIWLLWLRHRGA